MLEPLFGYHTSIFLEISIHFLIIILEIVSGKSFDCSYVITDLFIIEDCYEPKEHFRSNLGMWDNRITSLPPFP